jgi:hypothetical protein
VYDLGDFPLSGFTNRCGKLTSFFMFI